MQKANVSSGHIAVKDGGGRRKGKDRRGKVNQKPISKGSGQALTPRQAWVFNETSARGLPSRKV